MSHIHARSSTAQAAAPQDEFGSLPESPLLLAPAPDVRKVTPARSWRLLETNGCLAAGRASTQSRAQSRQSRIERFRGGAGHCVHGHNQLVVTRVGVTGSHPDTTFGREAC